MGNHISQKKPFSLLPAAVAILCAVLTCPLYALTPVVLDDAVGRLPLGLHLEVLEDPSGVLSINDVVSPGHSSRFRPSGREVINYGFSTSAIWVRFQLANRNRAVQERLLEIDFPMIDSIELYREDGRGGFHRQEIGETAPRGAREILYTNPVITLSVPPGTTPVFYLRYRDEGTVIFPALLWKIDEFIHGATIRQYVLGLYYGIIIIMVLYNLLLFFMVRDSGYAFYILHVLTFLGVTMIKDGYAQSTVFAGLSSWWINRILGICVCLAGVWIVQFSRIFLGTRGVNRTMDFFFKIGIVSFILTAIAYFFLDFATVGIVQTVLVIISTLVMVLFSLVLIAVYRSRPAILYFTAFFMLLLGIVLYNLKILDVLPSNIFTEYGLPAGHALQLALLSLGLGDRINAERKERIRAQEEALRNGQKAREAQAEAMEYQLQVVEALRKTDRLKDEFLANTSHELRTPLNGIIGIAESLMDGAAGDISSPVKENLALISTSGRRLENLINDILDFSRIKNRGLRLHRAPVDFRQVAEIVITLLRHTAEAKGVELKNLIPPGMPRVFGDENRLQQIMHNLVGNAIKFTDAGHILVGAVAAGDGEAAFLEVYIEDTGIGIPENKLGDIFNPFEQADASSSRSYGGTGLGLTITKKLVEMHGGAIRVESSEGRGTKIIFTLPVAREGARAEEPEEIITAEGGGAAGPGEGAGVLARPSQFREQQEEVKFRCLADTNVLVVDDDPVNLRVMKNMLGTALVSVRPASSGGEALQALEGGYRPDVAILDIMMPAMNGLELCERIRERFTMAELPVLFLTAKNQVHDLVSGFIAGGNDYVAKPFTKNELLARLKTLILLKNSVRDREALSVMRSELGIAKKIQEAIIPGVVPRLEGLAVSAKYYPFEAVGGDFFDFHVMEDGRLGVLLADVSGHGIPAALIASMIKIAFTFTHKYAGDPVAVLDRIRNATIDKLGGQFITASYVVIDTMAMRLGNARAGHPPVLLWRGNENRLIDICPRGSLIAPRFAVERQAESVKLEKRDRIIMYSDGMIEVRRGTAEIFGEQRFCRSILEHAGLPVEEMSAKIVDDIGRWNGSGDAFDDDATLIVIEVT